MVQRTSIAWTDLTSNPLKYRHKPTGKVVWACVKCSAGCAHCYSEALALRYKRGRPYTVANIQDVTPFLCPGECRRVLTRRESRGQRVFLCDMTDLFGEWVPTKLIHQLFGVMKQRGDVTFQILTKRPQRIAECLPPDWGNGYPNVWLGTSVENCKELWRIDALRELPAALRFLSCEPLLEGLYPLDLSGIGWVIVGGESGPHHRPMYPKWARDIECECEDAGIPFFFKQSAGLRPETGIELYGQVRRELPVVAI
jgi:protein gp37